VHVADSATLINVHRDNGQVITATAADVFTPVEIIDTMTSAAVLAAWQAELSHFQIELMIN